MSTVANDLLVQVVGRLRAAPAIIDGEGNAVLNIRRDHRTVVTRDQSPAIYILDGPEKQLIGKSCITREQTFSVMLFVRSDSGFAAADSLKLEVMRRLDPNTQQWADGVDIVPGNITPDAEIADQDALRVEMEFAFRYTTGVWTLDGLR